MVGLLCEVMAEPDHIPGIGRRGVVLVGVVGMAWLCMGGAVMCCR